MAALINTFKRGTVVVLTKDDWSHKKGERATVVSNDKSDNMPLFLKFANGDKLYFDLGSCRPLKTEESLKTTPNKRKPKRGSKNVRRTASAVR